jgi:membrane-bound lytic murein transglycosylase D
MEEPVLSPIASVSRLCAALAVVLLAAGCAGPAPREASEPQRPPPPAPAAAAPSAPAPSATSPVLRFEPLPVPATPPVQQPSLPLDAARLAPFEGQRLDLPQRRIAGIDRTVPAGDLWQRIRDGFGMPNLDNALVQEKVAFYVQRPDHLKRLFERSRRYLFYIVEELERRGLPTELALLPMVESSFNPMAYSRAHASGLWQFIPGTGKRYDLTQNWWYDGRRDIVASTGAALDYLKDVYDMHGDWQLALASYNWGENAVARAIEKNRAAGLPRDYSSLRMPLETQQYVPKLQALKNIIANPSSLGITIEPIPNQPYFAMVDRALNIDVRLAAKLAELPIEEFVALNPAFNRPLIPATLGNRLVLPADKVDVFHANLQKLDEKSLVSWQTYHLKPGEKLEAIAKRFGMSLAKLREVNGITARDRRIPNPLVVPIAGASIDIGRLPIMYAPPIPAPARRARIHTVRQGETLQSIAQRYSVTVDDLRRWNPVGRLQPGQKLSVEVRVAGRSSVRQPASKRSAPAKPRPVAKKPAVQRRAR